MPAPINPGVTPRQRARAPSFFKTDRKIENWFLYVGRLSYQNTGSRNF